MADVTSVRGETESEKAARRGAETPLQAFLVVELFPRAGAAAIREHTLPGAKRRDVVRDLAGCQWERPHRIVLIDETEGICRDVSAEIAQDILAQAARTGGKLHPIAAEFCARHATGRSE